MRFAIPAIFFAVVLAVTAGVFPRPALAGDSGSASVLPNRLMLAQNSGANLFSLLQDVQRLRRQVRQLRGKIQMLEHRIRRNKKSRQRMYQRLDKRLTALEQGGKSKASKEEIKSTYLAAFEKLRNGQYNAAIKALETFTQKHPDSAYTDNAWYWLGQARYVQGDLSGATAALKTVIKDFPKSPKMPSSLFRLGVIQQTLGKTDKARSTFQRIIRDYPDSGSADSARGRLQGMGG